MTDVYKKTNPLSDTLIRLCRCSSEPGGDSEFLRVGQGPLGETGTLLPVSAARGLHGIWAGLRGLLRYVLGAVIHL